MLISHRCYIIACLALAAQLACAAASAQSIVSPISATDEVHTDATKFLTTWRNEVIQKNLKQLSEHTWPEYKPAVAKSLQPPAGKLYQALYSGRHPIVSLLNQEPPTGLVLFRHQLNATGDYVVGCFAKERSDLTGVKTFVELMKRSNRQSLFCLSLFRERRGAGWMVDYSFAGEL